MLWSFGMHGAAIHHARLTYGEVGDVDHFLNFAIAFGFDLAHLKCNQATKRILVLAQRIRDVAYRFATYRGRYLTPRQE